MSYFLDTDSIALDRANNSIRNEKYQEAINIYRVEMTMLLEHGNYADFIKFVQSLADSYYFNKDFEKAGNCYFAIVAYNIWQHPDIIDDYAASNYNFLEFVLCWGTHLGYALYGWNDDYADYLLGKKNAPSDIKDFCLNIGEERIRTIFERLKNDSQIKRDDIPKDKSISASKYYMFDKDICRKIGKELFQYVVFEQLNFFKPSNF